VVVRVDAAFAKPELYEALEARGMRYAIRIPSNDILGPSTDQCGAGGGTRTPTGVSPGDFESPSSADSDTPARRVASIVPSAVTWLKGAAESIDKWAWPPRVL
jgi:hypothetical protein